MVAEKWVLGADQAEDGGGGTGDGIEFDIAAHADQSAVEAGLADGGPAHLFGGEAAEGATAGEEGAIGAFGGDEGDAVFTGDEAGAAGIAHLVAATGGELRGEFGEFVFVMGVGVGRGTVDGFEASVGERGESGGAVGAALEGAALGRGFGGDGGGVLAGAARPDGLDASAPGHDAVDAGGARGRFGAAGLIGEWAEDAGAAVGADAAQDETGAEPTSVAAGTAASLERLWVFHRVAARGALAGGEAEGSEEGAGFVEVGEGFGFGDECGIAAEDCGEGGEALGPELGGGAQTHLECVDEGERPCGGVAFDERGHEGGGESVPVACGTGTAQGIALLGGELGKDCGIEDAGVEEPLTHGSGGGDEEGTGGADEEAVGANAEMGFIVAVE